MSCQVRQDFQGAILRHFGCLFAEGRFRIVETMNECGGEYQMQLAESAQCRVKFKLEQETFYVLFARLDAPNTFRDEDPAGGVQWHAMQLVMTYEDQIHPGQAMNLPPGRDPGDLEDVLDAYATLLRPYLARFLSAFSPEPPVGWWKGYGAFLEARLA